MVISHDFFTHVENLEPKCPGCKGKLSFGETTTYEEKFSTHICKTCGFKF